MYTLHRSFLDHSFCDYIASVYKDAFIYDPSPRGTWNAYTLKNKTLYSEILAKFSPLVDYEFTTNWINVTEYSNDRGLWSHTDERSSLTIVSEISDNYIGGRFIINKDTYIKLNKGDVVMFNGSKIYHGVEPVSKGIRLSLNLWTQEISSKLL